MLDVIGQGSKYFKTKINDLSLGAKKINEYFKLSGKNKKQIKKTLECEKTDFTKIYENFWINYLMDPKNHGIKINDIIQEPEKDIYQSSYKLNNEGTQEECDKILELANFIDKTDGEGGEKFVMDMINDVRKGKNVGLIFAHTTIKDIPLFACYFLQVAMKNLKETDIEKKISDIANYLQIILGPAIMFHKDGFNMAHSLGNILKTRPTPDRFRDKIDSTIIDTIIKKFMLNLTRIAKNPKKDHGNIFLMAAGGTSAVIQGNEAFFPGKDSQTVASLGKVFGQLGNSTDDYSIYTVGVNNIQYAKREMIGKKKKSDVIIKMNNVTKEFQEFQDSQKNHKEKLKNISEESIKTESINNVEEKSDKMFNILANCIVNKKGEIIGKNIGKEEFSRRKDTVKRMRNKYKKFKGIIKILDY